MVEAASHHHVGQIQVTVLGQEGDHKTVTATEHETCHHLLEVGLKALYGEPAPPINDYDVVFNSKVVEPLSQTLAQAGIRDDSTVSILPKRISRG